MRIFWLLVSILVFSFGLAFSWHLNPEGVAQLPGHLIFNSAIAGEGEGDGGEGGDNAEDETILLDKKVYTKDDMENAVKLVDAKKTVNIVGTSNFRGTPYSFSWEFIQLSRYVPNFSAKLLNSWRGATTFARKRKLVKRARKTLLFLIKSGAPSKNKITTRMLEDALMVIRQFETRVKAEVRKEAEAKNKPSPDVRRSDIRLKQDIKLLATLSNGLNIYEYRYLWSPQKHIGVMAQEVRQIMPEAVKLIDGRLSVDYGLLFYAPALRHEFRQLGGVTHH